MRFKRLASPRNLRSKLSYLVFGLSDNLPGNRQACTSFFLSVGLLKALLRRPEIGLKVPELAHVENRITVPPSFRLHWQSQSPQRRTERDLIKALWMGFLAPAFPLSVPPIRQCHSNACQERP